MCPRLIADGQFLRKKMCHGLRSVKAVQWQALDPRNDSYDTKAEDYGDYLDY